MKTIKFPRLNDFCEVTSNGITQHVSYGNFWSDGQIVDWSAYWGKRKQRIYHSNFLHIDENGKCFNMNLYCYSAGKNAK